jgi:hypothetical protein
MLSAAASDQRSPAVVATNRKLTYSSGAWPLCDRLNV